VEAVIRKAEGYTKKIVRFESAEGINNKLLVLLNNQESSICSEGLPRPWRIRLLPYRAI
jgi:hypothetical protein